MSAYHENAAPGGATPPHEANPLPRPPAAVPVMPASAFDPRTKSPLLASFLSMMPGLGQAYIGNYGLAFIHILVFAGCITIVANDARELTLPLLPIFIGFFWLYNIIDAGRRAALYNYAVQAGAGLELPKDALATPRAGGSIAAGLLLVGGGIIALSSTRFGISLRWIEEWWPLAPIAFGGWLIGRAILDRKER
jgi:hypothetical protein